MQYVPVRGWRTGTPPKPPKAAMPEGVLFWRGDGEGDKVEERKTFDWWGGRAVGVPLGVGQRKQLIACRYKEVLWTE